MLSPAERWIAWRYLRPRKGEGFVSLVAGFALLGIALGVGTLIVVMAVMNGFREELMSRVLGVNGHATLIAGPAGITGYTSLTQALRGAPGVVEAFPYVDGQVMATAHEVAAGALIRGLPLEDLKRRPFLAENVLVGSLAALAEPDTVAVGSRMAMRLGLSLGSPLTLISPDGEATAIGTIPRIKTYRVAAIFEIGMYEYDNVLVYMALAEAQAFFSLDDRVSAIEIAVDDPDRIRAYAPGLIERAGGAGRLVDWMQSNGQFVNALNVERNVMFLILTLIILVAAFNIITGLTMLVRGKARDIAILRAMGATRGTIMRIFLLSGATIGVTGVLLGLVLGVWFASNIEAIRLWLEGLTGAQLFAPEIRFLSRMPARIEPAQTWAVVVMGLVLSLAATLWPSFRAARTDPVEALRYE